MKITKIYKLFTLTCLLFFCFCNITIAQTQNSKLKATVVDEQGKPLKEVNVLTSNGEKVSTDANGNFQIKMLNEEDTFTLEKKGFISKLVNVLDIDGDIILKKSPFLASEDDTIKMGVVTKSVREITGAISKINPKERLLFDNTQFLRNYINGLTLGVRGSENIRGIGSAIFVIDGVIGRDPNILNMEEVDQIAVLKDANAIALYGSQARNGVIVINTKRGKVNRKEVNVNVLSGFRTPVSLPNYLGSADYMTLYNEALTNDGVALDDGRRFSTERIQNTRNGLNPFEYPDVDYYSSQFIRPVTSFTNVITEFSGGNEKNQYYVNVGLNINDAWVNINDDINAGSNRFNVRGNIDFKVNDWITSSLDGIVVVSNNKSSRSNLLREATTLRPNLYSPFLPLDAISTSDPEVVGQLLAANTYNGMLLGSTQQFGANSPIALAIAGGYQNTVFRSTQFNNTINFDLDRITKGLSAKTYLSFDFYDSYNATIANQFKTYEPIWEGNKIRSFNVYGEDLKDQRENLSTNDFISRFGFYGLINYNTTLAKDHSLNTTFLAFYNSQRQNDAKQTDIDSHFGFQTSYDYKKKLFIDLTATYANSLKLPEGNRGALSPTAGIAYILSESSFLKNNKFINYLKIKASGGVIKSDRGITALNSGGSVNNASSAYYLYDSNYSNGSNINWADGNSNNIQTLTQGENLDLTFEERIDFNLGFEANLMNSFFVEANYFKTELDKQITFLQDQYPSYYNDFRPYVNYNKNLYTGFELGINYNKTYEDLSVSMGTNILYSQTERSKVSEVFAENYLQRQGREISTIFGLVDQGFYSEADFNSDASGNRVLNTGLAQPQFGNVQPGDIKYQDQNGDNIIDNDDRVAIGQSSSPLTYAFNLNLSYKRFSFFVLATGESGSKGNRLNSNFNQYYSIDGNDKYSEVVLGRWTPETADTATFPRLSSGTNQNNFRNSTFWLYNNNFFNISRAQFTYEFSDAVCNNMGVEDFSLNVSGTNLFEISKNKDIRQLRIGSDPLSRSFTLGLRMSF